MDIYPCTVDENAWDSEVSIRSLFGSLCSKDTFAHDARMTERRRRRDAIRSKKRQLDTKHAKVGTDTTDETYDSSGELAEPSRTQFDNNVGGVSKPPSKRLRPGNSTEERTPIRSADTAPKITTPSTTTSDAKRMNTIQKYFEAAADSDATRSSKNANSSEHHAKVSSAAYDKHEHSGLDTAEDPVAVPQGHAPADSNPHPDEASTTASDSDADRTESQLSLPDSAFCSEQAPGVSTHLSNQKVVNRKEAYKAALGRDGMDWATYSPISSGRVREEEVELG